MSLSCVIIGAVTAEVNDSSTKELMDYRVSNVHVQKYAFLERFLCQKMPQQFFLWAPPANISFGFLHLTLNGSRKCPKPTVNPNQTLAAQSVSHVDADSSPSWMHTFARMDTQHAHILKLSEGLGLICTLTCTNLCHTLDQKQTVRWSARTYMPTHAHTQTQTSNWSALKCTSLANTFFFLFHTQIFSKCFNFSKPVQKSAGRCEILFLQILDGRFVQWASCLEICGLPRAAVSCVL